VDLVVMGINFISPLFATDQLPLALANGLSVSQKNKYLLFTPLLGSEVQKKEPLRERLKGIVL
jgi:hypothetical protein